MLLILLCQIHSLFLLNSMSIIFLSIELIIVSNSVNSLSTIYSLINIKLIFYFYSLLILLMHSISLHILTVDIYSALAIFINLSILK